MSLRNLRIKHGYSMTEMGRILGVHRNTIYKWETRVCEPPLSTGLRIAEMFNVDAKELADADEVTA